MFSVVDPYLMVRLFFVCKKEKIIKEEKYEVAIGVETPFSYVMTRDLDCLKIFRFEALEVDELYFSRNFGALERIHSFREMELEILKKSDYVIFPWKTTEDYVRKYIWNGDNFVTTKYDCYPPKKTASYFFPTSIVSLGSVGYYWSNRALLSHLTHISHYVIDVYGRHRPPRKYHLNYKGYAPSLEVLSNCQFGLNTVRKIQRRCTPPESLVILRTVYLSYLQIGCSFRTN